MYVCVCGVGGKGNDHTMLLYSETSEKRTVWEQYKIEPFCPLLRGCPL